MAVRCETTVDLEGRTATVLRVPVDVLAVFGRHRPPVLVTIDEGPTYRSTVARYSGEHYLPLNRENRAAAGVEAGDTVTVEPAPDTAPREVDVPKDLAAALAADAPAASAFADLSYSHRKEYADWVAEAKRPDARTRRASKACDLLREGRTLR